MQFHTKVHRPPSENFENFGDESFGSEGGFPLAGWREWPHQSIVTGAYFWKRYTIQEVDIRLCSRNLSFFDVSNRR